jgi:hypothetical protein
MGLYEQYSPFVQFRKVNEAGFVVMFLELQMSRSKFPQV